jgi:hypothetical protein
MSGGDFSGYEHGSKGHEDYAADVRLGKKWAKRNGYDVRESQNVDWAAIGRRARREIERARKREAAERAAAERAAAEREAAEERKREELNETTGAFSMYDKNYSYLAEGGGKKRKSRRTKRKGSKRKGSRRGRKSRKTRKR